MSRVFVQIMDRGNKSLPTGNAIRCIHSDRLAFCRGLCRNCYRRDRGELSAPERIKRKAWLCEHIDRPNHTRGLCEPCAKFASYHADIQKSRDKGKTRSFQKRKEERTRAKIKDPDRGKRRYRDNKQAICLKLTCVRYGLTPDQLEVMFKTQQNRCYCGKDFGERFPLLAKRQWGVDHDHKCCPWNNKKTCGKCTRGLLCGACNIVLGVMKEEHRLLPKHLQDYLMIHEGKI